MIKAWAEKRRAARRRKTIGSIRDQMAFFGYPLDGLSDEQIEARVTELGRRIGRIGMSAEEVSMRLAGIAKMFEHPVARAAKLKPDEIDLEAFLRRQPH